jgi:PTH1 family peptidyl-tRNA hydrolase
MALFQKKTPQVSSSKSYYTLGLNKTVLIVGLGNIGKKYELTRHNVGFMTVDEFAKAVEADDWVLKKDLKCELAAGNMGDTKILIIKPTTLMNLSGEAVQAITQFYKIPLQQIVVVHDEIDMSFGTIRCRVGGSAAGHNGVKSVIQHLGEEFGRIRIGIANEISERADSSDFVLSKFSKKELEQVQSLAREVTTILTEYVYSGTLPHDTRSFKL